ncbi:MAG: hypothetical protein MI746_04015 [Pseudomonadales bacterium]|nr:hypothetical protein [Pseudomonadales bacterium]
MTVLFFSSLFLASASGYGQIRDDFFPSADTGPGRSEASGATYIENAQAQCLDKTGYYAQRAEDIRSRLSKTDQGSVSDYDEKVELCIELGLIGRALELLKEQFDTLRMNQGFKSLTLYEVIKARVNLTALLPPYQGKKEDLEKLIVLQLYSARQIFTENSFEHLIEKVEVSNDAIDFYLSQSSVAINQKARFAWLGRAYEVSQMMVSDYLDLIDVTKWSPHIADGYWYDLWLNQAFLDAYRVNAETESLLSRLSLQKAGQSYSDTSDFPDSLLNKSSDYFRSESNKAKNALDWYIGRHSDRARDWSHPELSDS